jgi:hypothetical protein
MAKQKGKDPACKADQVPHMTRTALSELQQDTNLWYKVHVLIYDLCNIKSDRSSESRTLDTTDELYISGPYFTPSEAAMIKGAIIECRRKPQEITYTEDDAKPEGLTVKREPKTVEEAVKEKLAGFFDKRKASGDSRPCGPHDMAPIYESVFAIKHSELEDPRFLGRLRRSGLRDAIEEGNASPKEKRKAGKARKARKVVEAEPCYLL